MTRTVLVVDDDPSILRAIRRAFWQSGFDLETAETPFSALQILAAKDVAIVISDMSMPEMNGAELLKQVANQYPQTSRILFSGFSAEQLLIKGIAEGDFISFFHKPWKIGEMIQYIDRILTIRAQLGFKYLRFANQKPVSLMTDIDKHISLASPSFITKDALADCVHQHPALMLAVLRVASSYFNNEKIDTLQKDIALLGSIPPSKLLFSNFIISNESSPEMPITEVTLMNHREYTCLFVDKFYLDVLKKPVPSFLRLACLFQNWGVFLNLQKYWADYTAVMKSYSSKNNKKSLVEIESEHLSLSSIKLCALLFSYWNINRQIVDCISASALPSEAQQSILEEAATLHIASHFAWRKISSGYFAPFDVSVLDHFSLQRTDVERVFGFLPE